MRKTMHGLAAVVALATLAAAPPAPVTLAIATWNVRSGMGIRGFGTRSWSHDTLNCTDRTKTLNAWGIGLPQRELRRIGADEAVVALAVQEAWNCGAPEKLRQVLGFRAATRERNGVATLARYGFDGPEVMQRIGAENGYDSWIVGGRVCLDPKCSKRLPVFSTHWGARQGREYPIQAQNVVRFLEGQPIPHIVAGDLNVYRFNRWSPKAPCANDDTPHRSGALDILAHAGYADAWAATQPGEGWTGMINRPDCGSPPGSVYRRIDYIFSKGLEVERTRQFARPRPGEDAASDHVGIVAAFRIPHAAVR